MCFKMNQKQKDQYNESLNQTKGYEILIKIYKLDGNPDNLFVVDEEFEEATLENRGNVRLDELNKKHKECTLKISKK